MRCWIRGRVSESGIENLPIDEELISDKMGRTIMAMRSAGDTLGRPYVAPPGTPADVLAILREGIAKVLKDPEMKEDIKKNKMEIQHVPAEECLRLVNYALNQPEAVVDALILNSPVTKKISP